MNIGHEILDQGIFVLSVPWPREAELIIIIGREDELLIWAIFMCAFRKITHSLG
jgi:hypothetical protein